jgi:hypothetical protein
MQERRGMWALQTGGKIQTEKGNNDWRNKRGLTSPCIITVLWIRKTDQLLRCNDPYL